MNNEIVENYLEAVSQAIGRGGSTKFWPFAPGQTDSYFIDLFAINLFEKFKKSPDRFKEGLFLLPPKVLRWFLLPFVILGLKLARNYEGYKVTEEEMVDFIKCVHEVLKERVQSDPFWMDGKNIILNKRQVESLVRRQHWFQGSRKQVADLGVNLEFYVWSINFDLFAYGVGWTGPYRTFGKTLLNKKFIDLNMPVWNINPPFRNIDIYYLFEGEIDTAIDFMSHISYEGIWEKLADFAVEVDGKNIESLEELGELSKYFSEERKKQVKRVLNLAPEEQIRKSAEIYYYMFHQLFEYFKEDPRPPKAFEERLKKEGLKSWEAFKPKSKAKKLDINFFRRLYDPRNSFTD